MKRRVLSWMLVIAMVCAMLPVHALAEMTPEVSGEPVTETFTHINPLYADVLTEADLVCPPEGPAVDTNAVSESDYATTFAEAGAQIREGMTQRLGTVVAYYQTETYDSANHKDIFNAAVAHTGVPKEGDSLRWVYGGYNVSISRYSSNGVYYVTYTYTMTYYTTAAQEAELDTAVDALLAQVDPAGTDYEKLCTVYDYLCENITYDYDNLEDTAYKLKYTAYAALINRTAVCQGYAALLYRLALEMGIDCRLITGIGNGGGHAWNIIRLGDVYYNADATWDAIWLQGVGYYSYYLQCEDTFTEGGTDHFRDAEYDTAEFHAAYPMSDTDFDPDADNGGSGGELPEEDMSGYLAYGQCGDGASWKLSQDGVLTIYGTGPMLDYMDYVDDFENKYKAPWYAFASQITKIVVESGITSVGDHAFMMCENVTEAAIPDSVTQIGQYAFLGCTSLESVELPKDLTELDNGAFYRCESLKSIVIPETVTVLSDAAFMFCSALEHVELPEKLVSIGGSAFQFCSSLTGIEIPESVTEIGMYAFEECTALKNVNLPGGITRVEMYTFQGCYSLKELVLPEGLCFIGDYAFSGCAFQEITIPASVSEIGTEAFRSCSYLQYVNFLGDAPVIGENAFLYNNTTMRYPSGNVSWTEDVKQNYGGNLTWVGTVDRGSCGDDLTWTVTDDGHLVISGSGDMTDYTEGTAPWYGLRDSISRLTVWNTVTSIGDWAFAHLESVTAPFLMYMTTMTRIGEGAFYESGLTSIALPEALETVEDRAFYGCTGLTAIDIPDRVTGIGEAAFQGCTGVTTVEMPNTVTSIGADAFRGCTALQRIEVPAAVTRVGDRAFAQDQALTSIYFLGDAPVIGADILADVTATAYYPMNNDTWTEAVRQNYGGTVTWQSFDASIWDSGSCGDRMTWVLKRDGVLTISGSGDMDDYAVRGAPWYPYYDKVTALIIEDGITSIGTWAFYRFNKLLSVELSDDLLDMGNYAFYACLSLPEVTLPEGLTRIGVCALASCQQMQQCNIPDTVREIGAGAFSGCTELASPIRIPAGINAIEDEAFRACHKIPSIEIPASVTYIGKYAFLSCMGLTRVEIPGRGVIIADNAFNDCQDLQEIVFTGRVSDIGTQAFHFCAGLTSLRLPGNIAGVGDWAFAYASGLNAIYFTGDAPEFTEEAFYAFSGTCYYPADNPTWTAEILGSTYGGNMTWKAYTPEESGDDVCGDNAAWVVENGQLSISGSGDMDDYSGAVGQPWYNQADSVTSVRVAGDVGKIGDHAFSGLTNLSEVILGDGVSGIGRNAFQGCSALTEIVLPASVNDVASQAFGSCTALNAVTFQGSAPDFGADAFSGVEAQVQYPAADPTWTDDVMQDYGGTLTWIPYGEARLTITAQPVDYVGMVGDTASFTVTAEGEDLRYQWYFSADNGTVWQKSSCMAPTLTVEFKAYRNNYLYYCVITDGAGNTVTSDTVRLAARETALVIITQPESFEGAVNDTASFTVEAAGNGLVYEWFFSADGGVSWSKSYSPGYQTDTLCPVLRTHRDGNMYKCVVTDIFGSSVESDAVTMAVSSSQIVILAQPQSVDNGVLGQLYQFAVTAQGENLTYRWEYSDDGGDTWQESWNQGYNSAVLNVRLNANRAGNLYRCAVTSGFKATVHTQSAELALQAPSAAIIAQSGHVYAVANQTATFTVEAEGNDLSYLWYRSNDKGATWNQTYLSGYNTDTLSFTANTNRAAMYMCKVTDGSGKAVWSEPVRLQILSARLQILNQPASVICAAGETAVFTVEAKGDTLKYQWYSSSDAGETWSVSYLTGYNTNVFSFTVNASRAARLYKCVITDAGGNTVETDAVSVELAG